MGLLSKLFPGADAVGEVAKKAGDILDKSFYTKQERAEDAAKMKLAEGEHYLRWMEATQGQNVARRMIAVMITGLWAFAWFLALLGNIARPWVSSHAEPLGESIAALQAAAGDMNTPLMLVLGFYFSSRVLSDHLRNRNKETKND